MMKILVPYSENIAEEIRRIIGDKAEVITSERTAEEMLRQGGDANIIASGKVPGKYIREAESLEMIQAFGAGVDKIDMDALRDRAEVIVCNCHLNSEEVAEYAVMLLLALAKRILRSDRLLRKGDWGMAWGSDIPNVEVRNKTCLLIGLGHIGSEIARRLRTFNMHIIAATRTGTGTTSSADELVSTKNAEKHIRKADFIILSLPLTKESRGMVDEKFLSYMKDSSFLINVSRAPIVNEEALFYKLKNEEIAGAAIDVWWDYPAEWGSAGQFPSEKHPFHNLDNVILSPHRAAYSENVMSDQIQFVAQNILRFIEGKEPLNQVDIENEY
ncbi:MAG: 2-hydroxyacid dehydrogenase [Promethearchaeia archaeon]